MNKVTKKQYDLCRASLEKITEEDLETIKKYFYYEPTGYSFADWYKKIDDMLVEEDNSEETSDSE